MASKASRLMTVVVAASVLVGGCASSDIMRGGDKMGGDKTSSGDKMTGDEKMGDGSMKKGDAMMEKK